jgi:formylglycine-generating enzyme required for sulfatase activity
VRARVVVVSVALATAGCALVVDLTGLGPADGGADAADASVVDAPSDVVADASDAGGDATDAPQGDGACSGSAGPKPIAIAGTRACIDSTEVRGSDYSTFLAAFDGGNAIIACAWKTTYVPSNEWPPDASNGNDPVAFVDWCDAYTYCSWAGKHLCGAFDGGASSVAASADPNADVWYRTCSSNGTNGYPYGNTYQPLACRGGDSQDGSVDTTVPVGSLAGCVAAGTFDLSGNVAEWSNACSGQASATDTCLLRGGGMHASSAKLTCASTNDVIARNSRADWAGIRCCSDQN